MDERWRFNLFRLRLAFLAVLCILHQNLELSWCLNDEGLALLRFRERVVNDPYGALSNWNGTDAEDPCSWFGVGCFGGKVVTLNLKDLCLGGTLAPELGSLIHIKSIVLRNNSFVGVIPKEFEELKELEVLDLGYNNFNGPLPSKLGSNLSLATLLLDNNSFLGSISPELHDLCMLSELQLGKNQLSDAAQRASCNRRSIAWSFDQARYISSRRLLQQRSASPLPRSRSNPRGTRTRQQTASISTPGPSPSSSPSPSPSTSPSPSPSLSPSPSPSPSPSLSPSPLFAFPTIMPSVPSPAPTPNLASPAPVDTPIVHSVQPPSHSVHIPHHRKKPRKNTWKRHHKLIISGVVGAFSLLFLLSIIVLICRRKKVVVVKPWATGLSGQLQKAFVTGVPKLNRSELETACEDFSNVIESSSDGKMYKGTLSSGVEIAVTSTTVASAKDWSKHLEGQFRKKIDTLSKINHKNFVNLLGYCEEEEPFTRMMVFEYAPNGTLFEHLHIKEAEHLEWGVRLRIAMGVAYCLEYMHQLSPPVFHNSLNSTAIYLTEDYAAKISDFSFWNGAAMAKMGLHSMDFSDVSDTSSSDPECNIYSFGMILLEMITGRLPYSYDSEQLVDWASDYLTRKEPAKYMVDPIVEYFEEDELEQLCEVVRACLHPDPKQRPTMRKVTAQMREITGMAPDGATPRLSPLWWAELEILSTSN